MSLVLAILEDIDMVYEGQSILDAEERGHFLQEDINMANEGLSLMIVEGYSTDVVSLCVMIRDFMEDNKFVAVAQCISLLKTLLDDYEE